MRKPRFGYREYSVLSTMFVEANGMTTKQIAAYFGWWLTECGKMAIEEEMNYQES